MRNNPHINNIVRDIFVMSTLKVGKEGAVHHILRRQTCHWWAFLWC